MLRLSATLLDSYRYYVDGIKSVDQLAQDVIGDVTPTPAMQLGRAFHEVFENPNLYMEVYDGAGVYHTDYADFDAEAVDKALGDIWQQKPLKEVKTEDLVLQTGMGPIRVVCKADALLGLEGFEIKTRDKTFYPERFFEALQWKAYVIGFGLNKISYRLVQLKLIKGVDIWTVKDVHTLPLYPYPKITQDVTEAACGLARFIEQQELQEYRQEAA